MRYVITSDIHLGSPHCRAAYFCEFISKLQDEVILVLAGDVVDDPQTSLGEAERSVLICLNRRAESFPVYWIHGNHDDGYVPPDCDAIKFVREFSVGGTLYVAHGDHFDNLMPNNEWFLWCFERLHSLRMKLGAHPVHVAEFAKRFSFLYSFLRKNVAANAVEHAAEHGFTAVACGHVHYPEDIIIKGIRYFNLGAWTEDPCFCLLVDDNCLTFVTVTEALQDSSFFKPA